MNKKMLNINDKETFLKIQENMIKEMDEHLEKISLKEMLKGLDKEPFYVLKHIFETISKGLYDSKDGKSCLSKYVRIIKENSSLKKAFAIMENMTRPQTISSSDIFVNENISFANSIDKKEYSEGLKKLSNIVKEAIEICKIKSSDLGKIISESNNQVSVSTDYIINNKKSLQNIAEYSNNVSVLMESVKKNIKEEDKEKNEAKTAKELFSDINESIKGLSAEEKNAIQELSLSTMAGKDGKDVFEAFKEKCEKLLEEAIENSEDIKSIARFQNMQEQIKKRAFNVETLNEDVLNFARLYETLKEDE